MDPVKIKEHYKKGYAHCKSFHEMPHYHHFLILCVCFLCRALKWDIVAVFPFELLVEFPLWLACKSILFSHGFLELTLRTSRKMFLLQQPPRLRMEFTSCPFSSVPA